MFQLLPASQRAALDIQKLVPLLKLEEACLAREAAADLQPSVACLPVEGHSW